MAVLAARIFRKVRAMLTSSAVYMKRNSVGKMKAMAPQFFFLLKKRLTLILLTKETGSASINQGINLKKGSTNY